MRPEASFIGQPIRALQTMLRVVAKNDPRHSAIIPDGIYGPETVQAVSVFQRLHGLPITGVTDRNTWEAVRRAYEPALVEQDEAHGLYIVLNPGQVLHLGDQSPHIRLVQALLVPLHQVYHTVLEPGSGDRLDEKTASSLASFQTLCDLPATGDLDKHTWKHLVLHYPLAAVLEIGGPGQNIDIL